jgi:predicted dehydrogenase
MALTLGDGRQVAVHLTSTSVQENRCELLGERGRLVGDRYAGTLELYPPLPPYGRAARARRALAGLGRLPGRLGAVARPPWDGRSHRAALSAFADAARSGGPARPDVDEGRRSLAVVLAAERSARTGRLVALEASR